MSSKLSLPLNIIRQTGKTHSGTVIFLHGSGDSGSGIQEWVKMLMEDFLFPHIVILYPSAPSQPYTALQGTHSNVWFDRKEISKRVPEDVQSIDSMAKRIVHLIDKEVQQGIPINKIVLGGFSMGGAMSLHVAYRYKPQIAGVFALSSFINDNSVLFDTLKESKNEKFPPLFQWHGSRDELVPQIWGEETFQTLQKLGIEGEFHIGKNALHELKSECLKKLHTWIKARVPE